MLLKLVNLLFAIVILIFVTDKTTEYLSLRKKISIGILCLVGLILQIIDLIKNLS